MEKIKIALVGCGRIAYKHFEAIENNRFYRLVAVCDVVDERAKKAAEKYKIPFFTDIETMLDAITPLYLITLCTPSGLHPQHAMLAAKQHKHVITEKPMACSLADAKAMIKTADQMKTKLFVVKQNRLNPTVEALKKAIDNGDFGRIYMVHSNVFWTRPQAYYDQAKRRGTWEFDGGAFMNQASHYIDLLQYLMGPVEYVQAMAKTLARNIEAEDTGVVNFTWRNGALGSIAMTILTYPKNLEGSITILGEYGTAKISGIALNKIDYWDLKNNQSPDHSEALNYQPENVYGSGHTPYYKNVADVMLNNSKPIADGRSGMKSVELLCAIYQSVKTGNKVSLPL